MSSVMTAILQCSGVKECAACQTQAPVTIPHGMWQLAICSHDRQQRQQQPLATACQKLGVVRRESWFVRSWSCKLLNAAAPSPAPQPARAARAPGTPSLTSSTSAGMRLTNSLRGTLKVTSSVRATTVAERRGGPPADSRTDMSPMMAPQPSRHTCADTHTAQASGRCTVAQGSIH